MPVTFLIVAAHLLLRLRWDLISATGGASVQIYFLTDGLGFTTDQTDASGNPTAGYTYDVFGATSSLNLISLLDAAHNNTRYASRRLEVFFVVPPP